MVIEWPRQCDYWGSVPVVAFIHKYGMLRGHFDGCMYGMLSTRGLHSESPGASLATPASCVMCCTTSAMAPMVTMSQRGLMRNSPRDILRKLSHWCTAHFGHSATRDTSGYPSRGVFRRSLSHVAGTSTWMPLYRAIVAMLMIMSVPCPWGVIHAVLTLQVTFWMMQMTQGVTPMFLSVMLLMLACHRDPHCILHP